MLAAGLGCGEQVVHGRLENAGEASLKVGEFGQALPTEQVRAGGRRVRQCPLAFRILTTRDPMSPVPLMTAIFMLMTTLCSLP
jgi:hypothetical protein